MHALVREQARRRPDAVAVVFPSLRGEPDALLTYAELDGRANALAARLAEEGIVEGDRVALYMERSLELIVAMLGVLKAGAAYVPIDPGYPRDRIAFMLKDAAAAVVLTQRALLATLAHGARIIELDPAWGASAPVLGPPRDLGAAQSLAYVIYTSGSTGTPKGVAVPHRGIVRLVLGTDYTPLDESRVMLQLAPISFDATTLEVWGPLLHGGRCVLFPGGSVPDPTELREVIAQNGITTLWLTASLFNTLVSEAPECLRGVPEILTGGEALSAPHVRLAQERLPGTQLVNGYGPTESTTFTACHRIPRDLPEGLRSIPIGRPIANTEVYVLDDERRLVGIGEPGELYIGGDGLALGYLDRPELTAERFVPSPFDAEARLYRTGDLVRWLEDGTLDFIGRIDEQVKLRGYRIELGEIEVALRDHPGIRDALVVLREDRPGDKRLVAYTTSDGAPPTAEELRAHLGSKLADYMVPSAFVALAAIPLTPNGKADRRALPPPEAHSKGRQASLQETRPPGSAGQSARGAATGGSRTERIIASVWSAVVGRDDIGLDENFFDAGGTSLGAIRVVARLRSEHGLNVPLVKVFEHPTIGALSRYVDSSENVAENELAQPARSAALANEPIAVIGMAGRFPGARSVEELWQVIVEGRETTRFFAPEELHPSLDSSLTSRPDYVRARGVVDDGDCFDHAFFAVSAREAALMDPQHRVLLETVHAALEDAGYDAERYRGAIGLYAGSGSTTYFNDNLCRSDAVSSAEEFTARLGNEKDFLVSRVAYKLNLRGPAVAVNTACSTSLVAIACAVRALRAGDCDVAVAGGVSIHTPQESGYIFQEGGMLSGDGRCRPFDAAAQGTLFNNGVGVVVLKRLRDAIADCDRIDAVVLGVGLNNDGSDKVSFSAPSVRGQAGAIARAHADAGVDPDTISYIEAHGTATPVGDPIEVEALTQAFRARTQRRGFCALGSVKSNVGHLVAAAGVAGFIKAVLALKHRVLPPTVGFERPNPDLRLDESPFWVSSELRRWDRGPTPRRAGVSSFGVGGTNAHAVLEEAPEAPHAAVARPSELLVLSAKTESALEELTARLAGYLASTTETLGDIGHTLAVGRRAFEHRRTVVARSADEARALLAGPRPRRTAARRDPPVAFLFPGQGSQYVGMGRGLYGRNEVFTETVDRCAEGLRAPLGVDLREVLYGAPDEDAAAAERLRHTELAQPSIFTMEYALALVWQSWGVSPEAMVGHSVGEFVCAVLAGVLSLDDALALVAERGRLMGTVAPGAMLSVRSAAAGVERRLGPTLALAADNAPSLCVVSGPTEDVDAFARVLEAEGIACKRLHTSHAFHSPMMDPIVPTFLERVRSVRLSAPRLRFVSTVTGDWITQEQATDATYWATHLRRPVRFAPAVARLLADSERVLLEVGPRATASQLALQQARRDAERIVVSSLGEGEPGQSARRAATATATGDAEWAALTSAVGKLWTAGVTPDWACFYAGQERRRVALPTYPFARVRCGVDIAHGRTAAAKPAVEPLTSPSTDGRAAQEITRTTMTRKEHLVGQVREVLEQISGEDVAPSDAATPFIELGFDSLFLTQAAQALSQKFGVKLKLRQLLETLSSADAVAAFLDEQLPRGAFEPAPQASAPVGQPARSAAPTNELVAPVPAPSTSAGSPATIALPISPLAALPAIALDPAAASSVQAVVAQQLALMARQLELLGALGASTPAVVAPVSPPAGRRPQTSPVPVAQNGSAKPNGAHPNGAPSNGTAPAKPAESDELLASATKKKGFGPQLHIDRAAGDTLTATQQRHFERLVLRYTDKTKRSKEFTAHNRAQLADPRAAAGFRPKLKEIVYPVVVERSSGCRLWDLDGNEYVDLLSGYGSNFLGYSPPFVTAAMKAQLDRGIEIGPQHPLTEEVASLMRELTGAERVAFCNTGSEAVLGTMRVARTVTGKNTVVLFNGGYHGMFDEVVVRGTKKLRSVPAAPGIPPSAVENVLVLEYGLPESLDVIRARAAEIAAVIVEPVQSRRPELQPVEFLRELRSITEQSGIAFVFDEVVTGFRCALGGAQERFGIRADIASYGKVMGGGLSIGVIAGRREFMDALDGGSWQYGDASIPEVGVTYFAGTFVRHPLALAAARAVLLHLKEQGPDLQRTVDARTERLVRTLNAHFERESAPLKLHHWSSIVKVAFTEDVPYGELLYVHLREKGVHVWDGRPSFLTTAHGDADIDFIVDAFKESVAEMQAGGFFPKPVRQERRDRPPLPGARLGRDRAGNPAWFVPDPKRPGGYVQLEVS